MDPANHRPSRPPEVSQNYIQKEVVKTVVTVVQRPSRERKTCEPTVYTCITTVGGFGNCLNGQPKSNRL